MGTRDTILDAAAQVMHRQGLAATTTREIAKTAGYSEATLYKHFRDKQDLFLSVLQERLPGLDAVQDLVGRATVAANLHVLVEQLMRFYFASFPIAASLFSQPVLLAEHRRLLSERGAGPRQPVQRLAHYLQAEQDRGRLSAKVDVAAMAALLAGAAFQQGFLANFEGVAELPDPQDWAARLVASVLGASEGALHS